MVVQDIFLTKTARDGRRGAARLGGVVRVGGRTVTNSERRVQRVRKALDPPGEARDDHGSSASSPRRLGHDWGAARPPRRSGTSCARSRPMHRGMSYARLEELGGIQWPCPSEDHPGSPFLHGRLWATTRSRGRAAPFIGRRP